MTQCCQRVYAGTVKGHPCARRATVERNGRHYCTVHDPVRRQARREAAYAKVRADIMVRLAAGEKAKRRQAAVDLLLKAAEALVQSCNGRVPASGSVTVDASHVRRLTSAVAGVRSVDTGEVPSEAKTDTP